MKKKNLKLHEVDFVVDRNNYMSAFRKNVFAYVDDKEITLNQISEEADIPYSTLKTFLYGDSKDCNLSTAVKLARALGISIDRLVGAETIESEVMEFALAYTKLPKSSKGLLRWHISNQTFIHETHIDKKMVTIMTPHCDGHGNLKQSTDYEHIDISNIGEDYRHKIFFGIKIPCEHYLPHYKENDILLIANDRNPMPNEIVVIIVDGNIVLTRRKTENNVVKYYGIRDGIYKSDEKDFINTVGYIVKVIEGQ